MSIINTFCKASLVCDFAQDLIDYVKDDCVVVFGGTICKDSPWPAAILTIASRFLLPYVSKKAKTYAVDGLKSKMSVLTSIFTNYRENRKSVRITDHVGKIYLLDWINTNSSIEDKNEMVGCVREQLQLDMLRSPDDLLKFSEMNFGQLASLLKDHDPRPYQHAIHDPVCVSLDDVAQFSTDSTDINPYSINYRRIVSLEEPPDTLPEIKYPEWMPDISNEDDCVFCDTSCIEAMPGGVGNGTCMSEFTWDNMDENWTCEGIMIDCNQSYIVAATCTNETHICSFNSTSGQDQCQPLPVINPPKEPRNRCMSEPGDDCYYMSKYYNDSSSGSSCNRNKHSSSDSSNGQSSSGSSNTGVSSLTLSNKQFCDDPKSCATDLGDFVVNSVYLGGNAIIPFEPGYSFMKGARRTLGRVVPPPNFQHTAVWFSDSDNAGDDSIGAILVYGEYYNLNGDPTYLGCDGARSFVMTLGEFKNMFRAFEVKKMKTGRNITLTTLLDESKRSGSWDADSYNWATNNCQHFSASVLKILEAKRADAKPEDWAEIPPPVMNSILITELTY